MKTKLLKKLLMVAGTALLLTGCASNQGGAGTNTMYGAGEGGANGSVSPSNPLGLTSGVGATPSYGP
jgi:hypothetical protein